MKGDRKNMVRNLVIDGSNLGSRVNKSRPSKVEKRSVASGSTSISLVAWSLILAVAVVFSGAFYLFQVNSIATQGFEIKKIENKIQDAEKENKKLKIKEIELKSMYNIEKATQEFNLVSPEDVSYVEIDGPVAMK
jgi:cell division protein FtsL